MRISVDSSNWTLVSIEWDALKISSRFMWDLSDKNLIISCTDLRWYLYLGRFKRFLCVFPLFLCAFHLFIMCTSTTFLKNCLKILLCVFHLFLCAIPLFLCAFPFTPWQLTNLINTLWNKSLIEQIINWHRPNFNLTTGKKESPRFLLSISISMK